MVSRYAASRHGLKMMTTAGCPEGTSDFMTVHLQQCEENLTKKRAALLAQPMALGAHSSGVQLPTALARVLIPSSVVHLLRCVPPELVGPWVTQHDPGFWQVPLTETDKTLIELAVPERGLGW
eukprot:4341533-Amphidinium_carterae.1